MVVKKDGRRETFDRFKILNGIKKACEKRPVSMAAMENVVQEIEKEVHNRMDKEINGKDLGDLVMVQLKKLDHVAYVRFASVYRQFKDIGEFVDEIKKLLG